jgi:hypothetical protein
MAIDINFPDKILAGVNQSYTITSDEGAPTGTISVATSGADGRTDVAHRIVPLGAPKDSAETTTSVMKYKVTFFLSDDSVGKEVKLAFQAGGSTTEEAREVTAS